MRGFRKKGQFFILAAVIISAMIFSLATISNDFFVVRDYPEFHEYANNIYVETNRVVSFIANNELDFSSNMTDFANRLAADVQTRNVAVDFVFVFGNSSEIVVLNLGASEIDVSDDIIDAVENKILVVVPNAGDIEVLGVYGSGENNRSISGVNGNVVFSYNGNVYNFKVSNYNRAMFLLKEEFNDEIYIEVK